MKRLIIAASLASALLAATGCDDKKSSQPPFPGTETPDTPPEKPVATERNEQYRPQIHFTPASNWINDPNGMVYAGGKYHLYYQYNPRGNDWGNMSWGHAVSTDLLHWEERGVAMTRNQWGYIFSGSAVTDKDNTAGFGKDAIIAFYTASGEHQQQCMAYSTDGGDTFTQYEGNPVIPNTSLPDFRDPKVFRHDESGKWIMALALGWSCKIEFWGSADLRHWERLSEFTTDSDRSNIGQWECPDLIRLPYGGGEKWVLIVSNNPGGPAGGSGTEYFVGDFDGREFKAMPLDYPLWLDHGADNYAGVTWSGIPDGRTVMISWMNNWNYAGSVPCTPWRSAMTLPRELSLRERDGKPVLSTTVVRELDAIAGEWTPAPDGAIAAPDAWEARMTVSLKKRSVITISNSEGERLELEVIPAAGRMVVRRNASTGASSFHNLFSIPGESVPLPAGETELELHVYADRSSVEIISADGTVAATNLVFPKSIYNRISGADNVSYRALRSVWSR